MKTTWKLVVSMLIGLVISGTALAERSAETLVRESCMKCHGPTGQSSDPTFPKLAGQNVDYLTRQMANFKTGVRTGKRMKKQMATVTSAEMVALAQYFSQQELTPAPASDPELTEIGRRIYFTGNPEHKVTACVTCHGPQGRGAMYLPRLAGQHARYLKRQLHAFRDHSRSSPNMVMHTVIETISDEDIDAVAQFLSTME